MKPTYIIIALCLVILFLGWKGCATERAKKDLVSQYESLLNNNLVSTQHWKDAYNKEHATNNTYILDQDIMESQIRDMADRLNIKPKQIKGETVYVTNTILSKKVDTVYKDGWVEIRKGKNDTIFITMNDTLIQTNYWKRKWLLAPKKYFVDIQNVNPYTHIQGIKSLEVRGKQSKFILGSGISFNPITHQLVPTITFLYIPLSIKF